MADHQTDSNRILLPFPENTRGARFRCRKKRFLVEVEDGKEIFWVHCNNSGSMLGLLKPGTDVLISLSKNPHRQLPYTLELVRFGGVWVGVNTLTPNRLLYDAWQAGLLPELQDCQLFRKEASSSKSRLDALLSCNGKPLWVEAKNVTLVEDDVAYFPDAISVRGQKHLFELTQLAKQGVRTACFFLIQRHDARCFAPADFIDPAFASLFWQALDEGVECWPYRAHVSISGIGLDRRLPLVDHR